MCITTGNNTCDAMAKLHLCGNIIPQIWHKTIVSEKTGKADLIAINILADIAYWYRPAEERDELTGETVGYHPKFAADILQRSYDDLAEHFGISKGQAKCAVIRLEQLGVVRRVFRKISVGGISIPNVLFLALNVDRLRELTYPDGDTTGGENAEMSNQLDKDVSENRHTSVENAPTPPSKNHQTNTENTTKISTAISPEITHSFNTVADGASEPMPAENIQNYLDARHQLSADWSSQPQVMRKAIEIAAEWDFRQVNGFSITKDELEHRRMATLSLMVSVLTEMCCAVKPWFCQGMPVDRTAVIERVNCVMHAERGSLESFAEYFIEAFIDASSTTVPSNSKAYMRALLWDHLTRYLVEWKCANP